VQLALLAVEGGAGQVVAAFLEVAHRFDLAAVGLVLDVGEDVQGLEDPAVVRQRVAELGRGPAGAQDAQDVVGGDRAGVDRRGDAQDVRPLPLDAVEVDAAARGGVRG